MKRKNPIAAIYMLTNIENGKIYIGETNDILSRISSHRCTPRRKKKYINTPIEKAIAKRGFDSFSWTVLLSQQDDNGIVDTTYRRKMEEEFISKYDATNPTIGYNILSCSNNWTIGNHTPHPIETSSRLKVSKPILEYNIETHAVMMYTNATSCTKIHGYSDKSMITQCVKKGQTLHGCCYYKLDINSRMIDICQIVEKKLKTIKKDKRKHTINSLISYLSGIQYIDEWCEKFGFCRTDTKMINKILESYNFTQLI